MQRDSPTSDFEQGQARFCESLSTVCVLASLALLIHAAHASEWVSRQASLGAGAADLALCVVVVCWIAAAIFGARRALALRHGASHFQARPDFEGEVG